MRFNRLVAAAGFLALCGFSFSSASAAVVTGSFAQASVVWISDPSPVSTGEASVHNENREFLPDTTVVRVGTSVRFPNDDPFFHSIYSSSPADPFDIGYYGFGPGKLVRFLHSGVIDVRCHIHPKMHGTIIVTDGPGPLNLVNTFRIEADLAGARRLEYWNPQSGLKSLDLFVPGANAVIDVGRLR